MLNSSEHSPVEEPGVAKQDEIDQEAEDESEIGLMDAYIAEFVR